MEAKPAPPSGTVKRRHDRIPFSGQAVLVLADGVTCTGTTRDVSLHGLFLVCKTAQEGVAIGQQGVLQLASSQSRKEFKCRIVHVANGGIGIELIDKDTEFSSDLTDSLMLETQFRVGMNVTEEQRILVSGRLLHATRQGTFQQARLSKIGLNHMECAIPPFAPFFPGAQDRLELRIMPPRHAPIVLEGVVRSLSQATDKICSVAFPDTPDKTIQQIKELMQRLIDERVQRVITTPDGRLGSGQTHPIKQVMKHFEGMFGKPKS